MYYDDEVSMDRDSGECDIWELEPEWREDIDYLSETKVPSREATRGLCVKGRLKVAGNQN